MEPLAAGLELAHRFRLIRPLGRGGRGEVWLAGDAWGGETVALKFPVDAAAAQALGAGFAATRELVHPAIVTPLAFIEEPRPFLVMPWIEGDDLGALRGAGFRDILRALLPVAEALEHAHRAGRVHRDLKPANVLRDLHGGVHLTDFAATPADAAGTLPSMSPQQLAGAPPTPADDVYGFGALLYELLAGVPLYHPEVTPERIRAGAPELPRTDRAGEALPAALRGLLGALLARSPQERPPGMAAVRAALATLLLDAGAEAAGATAIRPRERNAAAPAPAPASVRSARRGLPAAVVYAGLGLLAGAAAFVVFYLPRLVPERTTAPPAAVAPRPAGEAPPAEPAAAVGAPTVDRAQFDAVLGEWLRIEEEARERNVEGWAGSQWRDISAAAAAGDGAWRAGDLATALERYREAAAQGEELLARRPAVLADALREGAAAFERGDAVAAIARFDIALAIEPGQPQATRGIARARNLDRWRELMARAAAAEAGGDREGARSFYRQAATLDPGAPAARTALARLDGAAADEAYREQMARALAAQARGDSTAARAAYQAALRLRPGDAAAQAALAGAEADALARRLADELALAARAEETERWAEALALYEQVLAADASLDAARQGAARARTRGDLDRRLRAEIANAERFNDDAVYGKARALLEVARAIAAPGPVLAGQVAELDRLLRIAAVPVAVILESDNATEVTVYKVGRLGAFARQSLALRPGRYVAVGSRPGYRDVRRDFRVVADGANAPVVVRCEEPI